jgi:hypothetical protein
MNGQACFVVVWDDVGSKRVCDLDRRGVFILDEGNKEVIGVRKDGGGAD